MNTAQDYCQRIRYHARSRPSALALAYGDRAMTYADFWNGIRRRFSIQAAHGVKSGSTVLLHIEDPVDYLINLFAAIGHGATVVPASTRLRPKELTAIISLFRPDVVIVGREPKDAAISAFAQHSVRVLLVPDANAQSRLATDELCDGEYSLVHFSSGSSGIPKGVVRCRTNIWHEGRDVATALGLEPEDRVFCSSPIWHSFACGIVRAALHSGAGLVLSPGLDPRGLLDACAEWRVTITTGVPYLYQAMLELDTARRQFPPTVRLAIMGGVAPPPGLAAAFKEKFGVPLGQEYGLSEGGIVAVDVDPTPRTYATVGRAIPGVRVWAADENLHECEAGATGQIVVERLMGQGYYMGLPEESEQAFPSAGRVVTGDLGSIDAQRLIRITGRTKLMINAGGNKVDPREVELTILEDPAVGECLVCGVPDPTRGESVAALVVPVPGRTVHPGTILRRCRSSLMSFKVPREVKVVRELPRTESGKLLRNWLSISDRLA